MKIRKHFRCSKATIDYIISDITLNSIRDKDKYFNYSVNKRMEMLNKNYDEKLDEILTIIIRNCDYNNIPINYLAKLIMSLSKVSNILSKGFLAIINKGDIK